MPHWLSRLCQMVCFLMPPVNAFRCYLFLQCGLSCWKFSTMQLFLPFVCLLPFVLWFFILLEMTPDILSRRRPAGWSHRQGAGALAQLFLSSGMNSRTRWSGKQHFCKSWACILAVFGVLIGWVNSFVVQLKHRIVDGVYHTLGNGGEYTRS